MTIIGYFSKEKVLMFFHKMYSFFRFLRIKIHYINQYLKGHKI